MCLRRELTDLTRVKTFDNPAKCNAKLATWAATDPSLRIQRLLRLITQPEWLAEAARITLSIKGAHTPGVDGVNKTKMLQARLAVELQILRDELLSGHYQPLPARRVYIPKSNGKLRPLGIPALRIVLFQRAHADGDGADMGE